MIRIRLQIDARAEAAGLAGGTTPRAGACRDLTRTIRAPVRCRGWTRRGRAARCADGARSVRAWEGRRRAARRRTRRGGHRARAVAAHERGPDRATAGASRRTTGETGGAADLSGQAGEARRRFAGGSDPAGEAHARAASHRPVARARQRRDTDAAARRAHLARQAHVAARAAVEEIGRPVRDHQVAEVARLARGDSELKGYPSAEKVVLAGGQEMDLQIAARTGGAGERMPGDVERHAGLRTGGRAHTPDEAGEERRGFQSSSGRAGVTLGTGVPLRSWRSGGTGVALISLRALRAPSDEAFGGPATLAVADDAGLLAAFLNAGPNLALGVGDGAEPRRDGDCAGKGQACPVSRRKAHRESSVSKAGEARPCHLSRAWSRKSAPA
jgi:hypothetical protein